MSGCGQPKLRVLQLCKDADALDFEVWVGGGGSLRFLDKRLSEDGLLGERYFTGGGIHGGLDQNNFVRVPHESQASVDGFFRLRGIGGADGQHAYQDHDGKDDQRRHGVLAENLNAPGQPSVNEVKVQGKTQQQEKPDL